MGGIDGITENYVIDGENHIFFASFVLSNGNSEDQACRIPLLALDSN
jgi:hypothetical protein